MKFRNYAYGFIICLFACGRNPPQSQTDNPEQKQTRQTITSLQRVPYPANDNRSPIVVDTNKLVINFVDKHPFSDPQKNDIFSIALYGQSITEGIVVFEIFDSNRELIFNEKFAAKDLFSNQDDVFTDAQVRDSIKLKMARFFDKNRFSSPAIKADATLDWAFSNPDNVDSEEWEEIKKDRSSIVFIYSYGYEGLYGIAYNKKRKHVFLVFYSD
jgi:hypothetical protein